jgi:hypothetical protein
MTVRPDSGEYEQVTERERWCGLGHEKCKPGDQIAAGDIIMFFGQPHLIAEVEPYTGPLDFITGVARAGDGWGISLSASPCCVEVA